MNHSLKGMKSSSGLRMMYFGSVTVKSSQKLSLIHIFWQQDAESFVCMEPWNGWANSVNEEGHHEVLDVDEAMTSEWSITIEKA